MTHPFFKQSLYSGILGWGGYTHTTETMKWHDRWYDPGYYDKFDLLLKFYCKKIITNGTWGYNHLSWSVSTYNIPFWTGLKWESLSKTFTNHQHWTTISITNHPAWQIVPCFRLSKYPHCHFWKQKQRFGCGSHAPGVMQSPQGFHPSLKRLKRTAIMHPEHFYLRNKHDPIFHAAEKSPKKYSTTSNAGTKSMTQKKSNFFAKIPDKLCFHPCPGHPKPPPNPSLPPHPAQLHHTALKSPPTHIESTMSKKQGKF